LRNFDYHRAANLEEACRLIGELPRVQILAGGTDLLVDIESGLREAENVVSLRDVAEIRTIQKMSDHVSIGSGCTATQVESDAVIAEYFPELASMVVKFASPQIRNRATLAGNICSAVACGDFPPILTALGAEVELCSSGGKRVLPLSEFFVGNRATVRVENEILTRILVPFKPERAAAAYQKFRRRASNSLALVSVAAYLELDDIGCKEARIVLGAVAPTPLVVDEAARSLEGKPIDAIAVAAAGEIAAQTAQPITDIRATGDYRREIVKVLTERALWQALGQVNPNLEPRKDGHE
jgi:carbon-monoxide dehydrogenase medium subunit